MNVRRLFALGTLFVACGVAACIIGPKQDDPAEDRAVEDTGVMILDANLGGALDSAGAGADAAPPSPSDTATTDTGTVGDAARDASDASEVGDAADAAEGG